MSREKIKGPSIISLITKGIPFIMILTFCPHDQNKARYDIGVGNNGEVELELVKNSIVGRAKWKDGFPLSYEIHKSLKLDDYQRQKCEILIHKAIAFAIPKILLLVDHNTVLFTPSFPAYVDDGIPMTNEWDRELNKDGEEEIDGYYHTILGSWK